ncbi:MAG: hypothetical protein IJO20_00960 [Ruminococcus sp.]|nr:hypothetical protein [Ruminococcus sp.]MBQ7133045.1 hypothetical protein [Ruminococcus sp.]
MAKYSLLTQKHYDESIGDYISYGIICADNNNTITVADISVDKFAVEKIIEKFNIYELDVCHLYDAIEDFLYDFEI